MKCLALLAALSMLGSSCRPQGAPAPPPPQSSDEAGGSATASAPAPALSPEPLECRARDAARTFELHLSWDKNLARGTLVTLEGSAVTTRAVRAELYKGLVLVRAGAAESPEAVATVQEQGARQIQVGDFRQAWLPCE